MYFLSCFGLGKEKVPGWKVIKGSKQGAKWSKPVVT